jgi:hypothetical protein
MLARSLQVTVDGSEQGNVDSTAVSGGSILPLLAVPELSVSPASTRRHCPSLISLRYEQIPMWSPRL